MKDQKTSLLKTWAKDPRLKGAEILIVSDCLPELCPEVYKKFSAGRQVLSVCPEAEPGPVAYGKLASMLRSTNPSKLVVLTVECSPHCYTLQASVNEALYIAGLDIPTQRYVCLNGEAIPISAEAVRVSRYLHLVERLIQEQPDVVQRLGTLSLEQRAKPQEPTGSSRLQKATS